MNLASLHPLNVKIAELEAQLSASRASEARMGEALKVIINNAESQIVAFHSLCDLDQRDAQDAANLANWNRSIAQEALGLSTPTHSPTHRGAETMSNQPDHDLTCIQQALEDLAGRQGYQSAAVAALDRLRGERDALAAKVERQDSILAGVLFSGRIDDCTPSDLVGFGAAHDREILEAAWERADAAMCDWPDYGYQEVALKAAILGRE